MQPYGANDIGKQRRETGAGISRRHAARAIIIFCILAALMNGVAIRDAVRLKPYGPARQVWLWFAEPLATASEFSRLPMLRQTLDAWFHGEN